MSDDIIDSHVDSLRAGMHKHYKTEMQKKGVLGAWPELLEDAGGDHIEAVRAMSSSLGGVYVGPVVDPDTGEPGRESAVLRHERSKVIFGPPGSGKSTISLVPGMIQAAAAGMHTVLVGPQPKTMDDAQKAVRAVSYSGEMEILDVGGRIVEEGASRPTTWDPTTRCLSAEAARAFGRKLAGPGSPAAVDLGSGNGSGFWLQIPEIITAQAAHLVQVERVFKRMSALKAGLSAEEAEAISLSGKNRTGIHGVFDYLKRPAPADKSLEDTPFQGLSASLRTGLTPAQREGLARHPEKLRKLQRVIRNAAYNAASAPLSLQKLVYNKVLLTLQEKDLQEELGAERYEALLKQATPGYGAEEHPLKQRSSLMDEALMDDELTEVIGMVEEVGKGQKDPLLQLGRQVRGALPPLEQRILSPEPNDKETSPHKIIHGPPGFTVVAYDSGGSPGLGAGWFCDELIKEGLRFSKELQAEKKFGSTEKFCGMLLAADECSAMGYIDFALALEEGRQHETAVDIVATSYESLVDQIGPSRAAAIVNSAPYLIQYAPNSAASAEYSEGFGTKDETQATYNFASDTAGYHVSYSTQKVPLVPVERLKQLNDGEMVITSSSLDGKDRHTDVVRGHAFYEQGNPIGDLVAKVNGMDGLDLNWDELSPQAKARYEAKLAARQQALEPPPAPPQPGAVRMLPDDVQDQLDAMDDGTEQPGAIQTQPGDGEGIAKPPSATDAPAQQPAEQPAEIPAEPAKDAPAERQKDASAEQPAEQQKDTPAEQPAEIPAEQQKDVPAEQVKDAPALQSAEQPAEQPAEQVKDTPAEQPAEIPAEQQKDVPAEQVKDAPAQQPAEQPAEKQKDAPAEQVKDAPALQSAEPTVWVIEDTLEPKRPQDVPASDTSATAGPAESVRRDEPASMPERDEPAPTRDEPTSGPDDSSFGSSWGQL